MEQEILTENELERIKTLCEAALKAGVNWPLAVSLFPAQGEQERRWKEKMLKGIELVNPKALKN